MEPLWDDPEFAGDTIRCKNPKADLGSPEYPWDKVYANQIIAPVLPGAASNNFIFGNGWDCDATWPQANPTTQQYYRNLTIPVGETMDLSNDGFIPVIIRVSETLTVDGSIVTIGPNGGDAVDDAGGTSLFGDGGSTGFTGDGDGVLNPNVPGIYGFGGSGGQTMGGGNGAGHPGGALVGGALSRNKGDFFLDPSAAKIGFGNGSISGVDVYGEPGQPGSAGGGDGTNNGGGGGGGSGAGALNLVIFANKIVMGATGIIRSSGGNGGNGGNGTAGNTGGGGWGSGGGGGAIWIVYNSLVMAPGAVIESVGGDPGLPGQGFGTGTDAPSNPAIGLGTGGIVFRLNLTTGQYDSPVFVC